MTFEIFFFGWAVVGTDKVTKKVVVIHTGKPFHFCINDDKKEWEGLYIYILYLEICVNDVKAFLSLSVSFYYYYNHFCFLNNTFQ